MSTIVAESDVAVIDVDAASLQGSAATLSAKATLFASQTDTVTFDLRNNTQSYLNIDGSTELVLERIDALQPSATILTSAWDQVGDTMSLFAENVATLKSQADQLRSEIASLRLLVARDQAAHAESQSKADAADSEPWRLSGNLRLYNMNDDLIVRIQSHKARWDQLRADTIAALGAIKGGETNSFTTRGYLPGGAQLASGAAFASPEDIKKKFDNSKNRLGILSGYSASELAAFFDAYPDYVQKMWDEPPAPDDVAAWWNELDSGAKFALIAAVPAVIGNLGGLPYQDRDSANRIQMHEDRANYDNLSEEQQKTLTQLENAIKAGGTTQIVDYNLERYGGSMPHVALAYGNLDTADTATWMVGGMDTNASTATAGWSHAARNVLAQQNLLDSGSHATVAWLGYVAPDAIGVLSTAAADAGSNRFAAEIDGYYSSRGETGTIPHVSVVGHSYGTTVTATALTKTHHDVDSYVMVGSAGLDPANFWQNLDDINVKKTEAPAGGRVDAIYTTLATGDDLAPFGAWASERISPNPSDASGGMSVGGALSFSSEGADGLSRVDGHNPLGEKGKSEPSGFFSAAPSEGHGYFDFGTQSINNIAASALGKQDMIVGPLTPTSK